MKRTTLLSLIALGISGAAFGQNLQPTVLATAGDFHANSSHSLSWTLGEAAVTYIASSGHSLNQGFQQPSATIITAVEPWQPHAEGDLQVFPNPTRQDLNIRVTGNLLKKGETALLTDLTGRVLRQVRLNEFGAATISAADLPAALYLLELTESGRRLKVQKAN